MRGLKIGFLCTVCMLALVDPVHALEPGLVPQWIWSRRLTGQQSARFIRSFSIPSSIRSAMLRGRADNSMTVSILSTEGPKTEIGSFSSAQVSKPIDVTKFVSKGANTLVIDAVNRSGSAGVLVQLDIVLTDGQRMVIATDPRWFATEGESVFFSISLGLEGCPPWGEPHIETPEYNQWKSALKTGSATSAEQVSALPGFEVDLVRSSQPGEGSWINLEFDSKGRIVIGREGAGLLRYTLATGALNDGNAVPDRMEVINDTLLECRGLLFAHGSLFAHANNSKGLYRLRDTDGDDTFDEVKLLKATPGGVGHGRNDLALGPDGKIYAILGNDAQLPADFDTSHSPFSNYADDRLLKCAWDKYLFDSRAKLPGGHVIRTDAEGKTWELFAGGFRNPYGLAFSSAGELFTFDADNEGDLGTPWYRPTAISHIVPGGDYGWRQGTGMRPRWFPDCMPATLEMGKASPTGVKFGTRSNFPPTYKSALFALDWSYGVIYAVHLMPYQASYTATAEIFVAGRPLNVTDLDFGPDGAMYFVTGGRGTQSGLYRVRSIAGPPPTDDFAFPANLEADAQRVRKRLESGDIPEDFKLYSELDPWLRHGRQQFLETHPGAINPREHSRWSRTTLLAQARVGSRAEQTELLEGLLRDRFWPTPQQRDANLVLQEGELLVTRIVQISLARHGLPDAALTARLSKQFEGQFPGTTQSINQLQCELLVTLESPLVVAKTMPLLTAAETQEEILCWLFLLRNVKQGWTPETRRSYFEALQKAETFEGGREMSTAIYSIRVEALQTPTPEERLALEDVLKPQHAVAAIKANVRPVVREWKPEDVPTILATGGTRDLVRGQKLYVEAQCVHCHRLRGQGMPVGPDLSGAALRFGQKDLLDTILLPSKSIDDKYRNQTFQLKSGKVVTGRVITGDDKKLLVSPKPLEPDLIESVAMDDIETQTPSAVSPMPAGLVNTLSAEEILDLLAYLDAVALRKPIPAK